MHAKTEAILLSVLSVSVNLQKVELPIHNVVLQMNNINDINESIVKFNLQKLQYSAMNRSKHKRPRRLTC